MAVPVVANLNVKFSLTYIPQTDRHPGVQLQQKTYDKFHNMGIQNGSVFLCRGHCLDGVEGRGRTMLLRDTLL